MWGGGAGKGERGLCFYFIWGGGTLADLFCAVPEGEGGNWQAVVDVVINMFCLEKESAPLV